LITAGLGRLLAWTVTHLPGPLGWLAEASLLKLTFSLRDLSAAAQQIESALEVQDLPEARRLLSWHLVSRDTSNLGESQVAAATIESVAENASDGAVAPLLYYAWGGLPAALGYRFANTADAMLGYRDQAHEWLGKAAARLDDLANLLPARVTAGLFLLAAALIGEDARRGWQIWRRDAGKTASPNAGHPMSAMAGTLGLELEKVGHYRLGAGQRSPRPSDIARAVRLIRLIPLLIVGWLMILSASRSSRCSREAP
jgi:adenosylcobinamide-phosphate synthase